MTLLSAVDEFIYQELSLFSRLERPTEQELDPELQDVVPPFDIDIEPRLMDGIHPPPPIMACELRDDTLL